MQQADDPVSVAKDAMMGSDGPAFDSSFNVDELNAVLKQYNK